MSQHHEIGVAAVLDADKLQVGNYVEIEGQLVKVDYMIGDAIYFKIITGPELWKFRVISLWQKRKTRLISCALIAMGAIIWYLTK